MGTITDKITYLNTTKSQLKDQINYGLPTEKQITNSTTFRNYVSSIFEAFLEALRNPDTLFTNLPKTSGSGSNITLNNTANAPMRITLNPTALSQDGTPTPSSPQDIHTISGNNSVVVDNGNGLSQTNLINLGEIEYCKIGDYEDKFIRSGGEQLLNKSLGFTNAYITSTGSILNASTNALFNGYIAVEPNTSYTMSCNKSVNNLGISEFNGSQTFIKRTQANSATSNTIITDSSTRYLRVQFNYDNSTTITQTIIDGLEIMLNKGTTALPYVPYEKGWYIKKNIGKYAINTNNISARTSYTNIDYAQIPKPTDAINYNVWGHSQVLCNKATWSNSTSTLDSVDNIGIIFTGTAQNVYWIGFSKNTALSSMKTQLEGTIIYYILATPTYTKITGELANQLEQVYKGMLSYDGTTNISQVNNDLAFVINASALEDLM